MELKDLAGPKGDLYITFTIDNHTDFKRDKSNLYATSDLIKTHKDTDNFLSRLVMT
jgi:DnaJ-class molecular chaperone